MSPRSSEPGPVVIKYGGSLLDDPARQRHLLEQVAREWKARRRKLVLVHGGGKAISRALEERGITPRFVEGRRFTDDATMAVVDEVLGATNADIVRQLTEDGASARGYSGKTRRLVTAEPLAGLGRVGKPVRVEVEALQSILSGEELPVFYSVALDAGGRPINVNADDFAQELAIAARADELIFLTDTGGILDRERRLIELLGTRNVEPLVADGTISGGMMVKARACVEAIRRGVRRVTIGPIASTASGLQVRGTSFIDGDALEVEGAHG